jgi:putative tricarboxylic transport membrane protein
MKDFLLGCIISLISKRILFMKVKTIIAIALVLMTLVASAYGEIAPYPHRVTTIITHSSPGGGSDVFLRELITYLDDYIDTTFIIENIRGGSGASAIARVASSPADGSVIYASTPTYILTSLLSNPSKTYKDLDPMINIFIDQEIIYTRVDAPFASLTEVVEMSKNKRVNWGAANPASLERIALEELKVTSGANASIITHDGGGELLLNVLNGTLELGVGEAQELDSQIRSNQIKVLAIFSSVRSPLLPNVPTVSELGFNVELTKFRGFAVPNNTPIEISEIFYHAISQLLNDPGYKEQYTNNLLMSYLLDKEDFGNFINAFIDDTESTFNELGMR